MSMWLILRELCIISFNLPLINVYIVYCSHSIQYKLYYIRQQLSISFLFVNVTLYFVDILLRLHSETSFNSKTKFLKKKKRKKIDLPRARLEPCSVSSQILATYCAKLFPNPPLWCR